MDAGVYFIQEELAEYGIDWFGPTAEDEDRVEQVIVPRIPDLLGDSELSVLQTVIDPLQQCDDYGRAMYIATNSLVRDMIDRRIRNVM